MTVVHKETRGLRGVEAIRIGSVLHRANCRPIRILHVVSRMNRAGIETWLMHVLRRVDRRRFQMDFLVHRDEPGHFDAEIRELGSRLLYAAPLRNVITYSQRLQNLLRSLPPYDVVHSHLDYFSGYPLKCAAQAGVPVRIAHSHNDLTRSFTHLRWSLKMYVRRSRWLVAQCGTYGLAASATAGESLFGSRQATFPWQVMPCGIDFTPFAPGSVREDIRREFGIPSDSIVVGHVGRFAEQKNHAMILDIAEAIRRRTDKFHLLLVGDGPLQARIAEDVNQRGLASCITFAGVRADVPRLFTSLFDVFLFPSLFEGLGLVLVEAQAAGCPVVISDVIPQEADMVSRLVTRIPLTMNVDHWAKAVLLAAQASRSRAARLSAYETVASSAFNISVCRQNLTSLYIDQLSNRRAA